MNAGEAGPRSTISQTIRNSLLVLIFELIGTMFLTILFN